MPLGATRPCHPGATQLVAPSSLSSSGPSTTAPGASSARATTGTVRDSPSIHALAAVRRRRGLDADRCAVRRRAASGRSIASAITDAITRPADSSAKPYSRRCASKNAPARAAASCHGSSTAVSDPARRRCALSRTSVAAAATACRPSSARASRSSRCSDCQRRFVARGIERKLDRAPADRAPAGEADAVGRQHAGQRVQQHLLDAEPLGDRAGVLARRAAEAEQAALRRVGAALQRQFADRVRHARAGHVDERGRERLGAERRRRTRRARRPPVPPAVRARPRRRSRRRPRDRRPAGSAAGRTRPSTTLQSVMVAGPPRR